MTLKEALEKWVEAAKKRVPNPLETNGMKDKGVPIHD